MPNSRWSVLELYTLFKKCFKLLEKRDRFLLAFSFALQNVLILLEILGLILIGGIVAIAASAVQSKEFPEVINVFLDILGLSKLTPQLSATILGIIAAVLLLSKSILSYYLGLRSFAFLATREAKISEQLSKQVLSSNLIKLNRFSIPEYQHALTIGSSSVMGGVLGQSLSLFVELALQISMIATLFFFSPFLTIFCLIYFASLFLVLNYIQGAKAREWGSAMTDADVSSLRLISEVILSYREIAVSGRRDYFQKEIVSARKNSASFQVKKAMLAQFSKYIFESSVVIACLGVSAFAFSTKSAVEASSLVAIFLAASSRVSTSVLRLQQGILQLRGAAGATELFFKIYTPEESLEKEVSEEKISSLEFDSSVETSPSISIRNLSFTYPGALTPTIKNVSLTIAPNSSTAIVGPSGAGKSTLVDLILGLIEPGEGTRQIHGKAPSDYHQLKTGGIAYVPQAINLKSGTILENVAFGLNSNEVNPDKVAQIIKLVGLQKWVDNLPGGL